MLHTSEVSIPGGMINESQVARLLTSSKALGCVYESDAIGQRFLNVSVVASS